MLLSSCVSVHSRLLSHFQTQTANSKRKQSSSEQIHEELDVRVRKLSRRLIGLVECLVNCCLALGMKFRVNDEVPPGKCVCYPVCIAFACAAISVLTIGLDK
jgi:hypothetical protein